MRTTLRKKRGGTKKPTKKEIDKRKIDFTKKKKTNTKSRKKRIKAWIWFLIILFVSFFIALPTWRVLDVYSKVVIDDEGMGIFDTLNEGIKVLKDDPLKGEENDRINILALGMRGEDDPHGGLLTDSIMIISYKPSTDETALISIPRDLYVKIPDYGRNIHKINSVYWIGEQEQEGAGVEYTRKTVASVLNIPIHYLVRVDMQAFKDVIEVLDGIDVYLEEPFSETKQFGSYKFKLPAGENHLGPDEAFYYVQSRFQSSDFDRARRQQEVIIAIRDKAKEVGIFTSPSKINQLISVVEDNVITDMKPWEINKIMKIAKDIDLDSTQRLVLDNSPGGFLYSTYVGEAYALRPVGNDFGKIQEAANLIFEVTIDTETNTIEKPSAID